LLLVVVMAYRLALNEVTAKAGRSVAVGATSVPARAWRAQAGGAVRAGTP
jgi:hypothetical protein